MFAQIQKDAVDKNEDVEFVDNVYSDIERFDSTLKSIKS